jgi:hypothetical protein
MIAKGKSRFMCALLPASANWMRSERDVAAPLKQDAPALRRDLRFEPGFQLVQIDHREMHVNSWIHSGSANPPAAILACAASVH